MSTTPLKTTFEILDSYADLLFSVLTSFQHLTKKKMGSSEICPPLDIIVQELPNIFCNKLSDKTEPTILSSTICLLENLPEEKFYEKNVIKILLHPLDFADIRVKPSMPSDIRVFAHTVNKLLGDSCSTYSREQGFIYATLRHDVCVKKLLDHNYLQFRKAINKYTTDPETREYRRFDMLAIFLLICVNSTYYKKGTLNDNDLNILTKLLKVLTASHTKTLKKNDERL